MIVLITMYFVIRAVVMAIAAGKAEFKKPVADGLTHNGMALIAAVVTIAFNALAALLVVWLDHPVALVLYVALDIYAVTRR